MPEPVGEHNISFYLSALVDGELDAGQAAEVLRYLSDHPTSTQVANVYVQMKANAKRVLEQSAPPAPQALRERIEKIQLSEIAPPKATSRFGFAKLAACAAGILIIGALIGHFAIPQKPIGRLPQPGSETASNVIPATLMDAITHVHVDCSRFSAEMHAGGIPEELHGLSEAISVDLAKGGTYPDLSKAGYAIIGAGPCRLPAKDTVHLLYRSTQEKVHDTLSIFVQPFTNQITIETGKTYLVTHAGAAHPMIVWRTNKTVYFLIGDDSDEVQRAKDVIGISN